MVDFPPLPADSGASREGVQDADLSLPDFKQEGPISDAPAKDAPLPDTAVPSDHAVEKDNPVPKDTAPEQDTVGPCTWKTVSSGTTLALNGVWTNSSSGWIVGAGGTILKLNTSNNTWSNVTSPTTADLTAIRGISSSNVWVSGAGGVVLRYNTSWQDQAQPNKKNLYGIWLNSATNVWAVGTTGTIVHRASGGWSTVASSVSNNLNAVWGSGSNNIWSVGVNHTAVHYDGSAWSVSSVWGTGEFEAVFGRSSGNVWVAGSYFSAGSTYPLVLRYNGTSWSDRSPSGTNMAFRGVWVSGTGAVFAVGVEPSSNAGLIMRRSGGSWSNVTPSGTTLGALNAVWGGGDCDIWAVGQGGTIVRFDPT